MTLVKTVTGLNIYTVEDYSTEILLTKRKKQVETWFCTHSTFCFALFLCLKNKTKPSFGQKMKLRLA